MSILLSFDSIVESQKQPKIQTQKSTNPNTTHSSVWGKGTGFGGDRGSYTGRSNRHNPNPADPSINNKQSELDLKIFDSMKILTQQCRDRSIDPMSMLSSTSLKIIVRDLLMNGSFQDIGSRSELYQSVFEFISFISQDHTTAEFMLSPISLTDSPSPSTTSTKPNETLESLMTQLAHQARIFISLNQHQMSSPENEGVDQDTAEALAMALHIQDVHASLSEGLEILKVMRESLGMGITQEGVVDLIQSSTITTSSSSTTSTSISTSTSPSTTSTPTTQDLIAAEAREYTTTLGPLRFESISLCELTQQPNSGISHVLLHPQRGVSFSLPGPSTDLDNGSTLDPTQARKRMKRIATEMTDLSRSLPVEHAASIFVLCDEDRMDVIKALVIGPEDTPYANGCFEFDILLPMDYPNSPPKVQLVTTGQGTMRFNPNLYNCGKVCLSLLGTWAGPGWNPTSSTLLQVLVSIQSLIMVPDPYYNEPGHEAHESKAASESYNQNIRRGTVLFAIRDQLRSILNENEKEKDNNPDFSSTISSTSTSTSPQFPSLTSSSSSFPSSFPTSSFPQPPSSLASPSITSYSSVFRERMRHHFRIKSRSIFNQIISWYTLNHNNNNNNNRIYNNYNDPSGQQLVSFPSMRFPSSISSPIPLDTIEEIRSLLIQIGGDLEIKHIPIPPPPPLPPSLPLPPPPLSSVPPPMMSSTIPKKYQFSPQNNNTKKNRKNLNPPFPSTFQSAAFNNHFPQPFPPPPPSSSQNPFGSTSYSSPSQLQPSFSNLMSSTASASSLTPPTQLFPSSPTKPTPSPSINPPQGHYPSGFNQTSGFGAGFGQAQQGQGQGQNPPGFGAGFGQAQQGQGHGFHQQPSGFGAVPSTGFGGHNPQHGVSPAPLGGSMGFSNQEEEEEKQLEQAILRSLQGGTGAGSGAGVGLGPGGGSEEDQLEAAILRSLLPNSTVGMDQGEDEDEQLRLAIQQSLQEK